MPSVAVHADAMSPTTELQAAEILVRIGARLQGLGMKRRRAGIYVWPASPTTLGQVWLQANRRGGELVEIEPIIGGRYLPLADTIARVRGVRLHPYNPRSYVALLSNLVPIDERGQDQYGLPGWNFWRDVGTWRGTIDHLISAVESYAIPWVVAHDSLEAVAAESLRFFPQPGGSPQDLEQVPALLLLRDGPQAALEALDVALSAFGGRTDAYAIAASAYAGAFREYVAAQT
jgi:hypothetical protein